MNPPAQGSEDNSCQTIEIVSDHRATKRYSGRRVNGGANSGGRAPLTSASSVLKKMVKNLSVREYHRDGTVKDEVGAESVSPLHPFSVKGVSVTIMIFVRGHRYTAYVNSFTMF